MKKIITITTDFGNTDAYVSIMKGVILSINRETILIDITNEIKPYSIVSASYVLCSAWNYYPQGTIFLSVVDPGVGSKRGILIATEGERENPRVLIAPDNGTVSMLTRMKKITHFYRPSEIAMNEIQKLFPQRSSTFHGRDIFSPLAGLTAKYGLQMVLGESIKPVILESVNPVIQNKGGIKKIQGKIIHIDHFGNCVSSIRRDNLGDSIEEETLKKTAIRIKQFKIDGIMHYFNEVPSGMPLAYIGSASFIETALNQGNMAKELGIRIGDNIELEIPSQ